MQSLLIGFLMLGVTEAFVRPFAKFVVLQTSRAWLPKVLQILDPALPDLIKEGSEDHLKSVVLSVYENVTGHEYYNKAQILKTFEEYYSPFKNAGKLNGKQ